MVVCSVGWGHGLEVLEARWEPNVGERHDRDDDCLGVGDLEIGVVGAVDGRTDDGGVDGRGEEG
jgi:hypothetical protein